MIKILSFPLLAFLLALFAACSSGPTELPGGAYRFLVVEGNIRSLSLGDGPMQVTFKHNPKATQAMRDAGDL